MAKSRIPLVALAVTLLSAAGCPPPPDDGGVGSGGGESTWPPAQEYEASTTVLESATHGPELCLGSVADSLPPQCGDVPVTNWDWSDVDDEKSANGTRWGDYRVVGTYDGEVFTMTEAPEPASAADPPGGSTEITTPCPEPAGGWQPVDPDRTTDIDEQAAMDHAQRAPDSAGAWIDNRQPIPRDGMIDRSRIVLNMAFTGDLERHEREARQIWGGALCVVRYERTEAELRAIQDQLTDTINELGLQFLWSGVDIVRNRVTLGVVALRDGNQEQLDRRFGEGVVEARAQLQPVP